MGDENKKPYILYVAEAIYLEIFQIKKQNIDISNLDAIERFMGSKLYEKVSSGKFHDEWFFIFFSHKIINLVCNNKN